MLSSYSSYLPINDHIIYYRLFQVLQKLREKKLIAMARHLSLRVVAMASVTTTSFDTSRRRN